MSRHRDRGQSHRPLVQIDISLTLPHQVIWLLAGIATGHLHAFVRLVENLDRVLRVVAG